MTYMVAQKVITKLGGAKAVAEILGISRQCVTRWTWPKDRQGTGGLIPTARVPELLKYSEKHKLSLTQQDFFIEDNEVEDDLAN